MNLKRVLSSRNVDLQIHLKNNLKVMNLGLKEREKSNIRRKRKQILRNIVLYYHNHNKNKRILQKSHLQSQNHCRIYRSSLLDNHNLNLAKNHQPKCQVTMVNMLF